MFPFHVTLGHYEIGSCCPDFGSLPWYVYWPSDSSYASQFACDPNWANPYTGGAIDFGCSHGEFAGAVVQPPAQWNNAPSYWYGK